MKINLSISPELLEEVDKRSKALGISRSAYIAFAVLEKMKIDDTMSIMPQLLMKIDKNEEEM